MDELVRQGHRLTGELINSVESRLVEVLGSLGVEGRLLTYGQFVETGVSKDKIPYSGRSGKGGKSKYITGVINWAQIKFSLDATNHLKTGMPSRGKAFTGFVTKALDNKVDEITKLLFEANGEQLSFLVDNMITRQQKNFPG